jgi:imidazole glycerol-phosphate synthase subunit HisH
MRKIGVVDYGVGNIRSITNVLAKFDCKVILSYSKKELLDCDGLILPGVGAFKHAMSKLKNKRLDQILKLYVESGKPFLGICLGMQMLFDESNEFGNSKGLGFIPGNVERFELQKDTKLPHIAWSPIFTSEQSDWNETILNNLNNHTDMYHVHSYYAKPQNNNNILSYSMYNNFKFCSTVKRNNVYGCQYHPEKSATDGLKIISNFINLT